MPLQVKYIISMAVVIQVDLRICVLVALFLVWIHVERKVFQNNITVAIRDLREDISEIKVTLNDVRENQRGPVERVGRLVCRAVANKHPVGEYCDSIVDAITMVLSFKKII